MRSCKIILVRKIRDEGVILKACKTCTDEYGVSEKLEKLGIEVEYMGEPLTRYLKEGKRVITF